MSQPVDLKPIHIQELLAFELACLGAYTDRLSPTEVGLTNTSREFWQNASLEERDIARREAARFLGRLEAMGLGVRVADNKEVTKTIEFLLTVPPRIAYELPIPAKEPETPTIVLPNPRPPV